MINTKTYHTYLSSTIKIKDYVSFMKSKGFQFASVCDLNSCSSFYELQKECNAQGIKPVFGVDLNVCLNAKRKPDKKASMLSLDDNSDYMETGNIRLWAENDKGLENIYHIVSKAWSDEYFYYAPRTDIDSILDKSENVIIATGGTESWINKKIRSNPLEAKELILKIYDKIKDRLMIELLTEHSFASSIVNKFYKSIKSCIEEATFVPSAEIYFTKDDEYRTHKVLSAIKRVSKSGASGAVDIEGSGLKGVSSLECFIDGLDNGFKSINSEDYGIDLNEELQNFAARCNATVKINPNAMLMPDTGFDDPDAELRALCEKQIVEFGLSKNQVYVDRLERELKSLKDLKFSSYILYIKTILDMARERNIPYGPGRGSAAGSLVNYLIGNTLIDPIKYDLLFERYIDPQRVSPPDNDIDFPPSRVPELIEAIKERWGVNSVAYICSFSEIGPKVAIADCCRIHGVSIVNTRTLASSVDKDDYSFTGLESPDSKKIISKYPNLLEDIKSIVGLYRQTGVHAAGLVCSDGHINNYIPTHSIVDISGNRVLCSSFDKDGAESVGLLKVDLLKLIGIDVIQDCQELIRKNHDRTFDINNIDYEDKGTLELFAQGEFDGVFQFDSDVVRAYCNKFKDPFLNFEFISHVTSLIRPGPADSGQADQYIERYNRNRHEYNKVDYHPIVSDITSTTLGVIVYQEQVSRVFGELSHHENPDKMRKLIAKSKGVDELEVNRDVFVRDSLSNNNDISEQIANKLFNDIVTFGRYGFNKSHAIAYSAITFQFQWLKKYYPLYYWFALIKHANENNKRSYAIKAKQYGVGVKGIDVNTSGFDISVDVENNSIIEGFSGVVGIQQKTTQKIIENRPYKNAADLIIKLGPSLTKKLCECGAANNIVKNTKVVIDFADDIKKRLGAKRDELNEDNLQDYIDELSKSNKDYSDYQKRVMATTVNKSSIDNPFLDQTEKACHFIVKSFTEFEETNPSLAPTLFCNQNVWLRGYVSGIKENPHNPAYKREPTKKEKEHESFGKLECRCQITTENGGRYQIKIPWDQYEQHKIKEGSYILVACNFNYRATATASCVIDLSDLKNDNNVHLSAFKHNPILKILKSNPSAFGNDSHIALQNIDSKIQDVRDGLHAGVRAYGIVCGFKTKVTTKDTLKLDMSIICPNGYIGNITAFERTLLTGVSAEDFEKTTVGSLVRMDLKRNVWRDMESFVIQDDSYFLYKSGQNSST